MLRVIRVLKSNQSADRGIMYLVGMRECERGLVQKGNEERRQVKPTRLTDAEQKNIFPLGEISLVSLSSAPFS